MTQTESRARDATPKAIEDRHTLLAWTLPDFDKLPWFERKEAAVG